ncbi:ATP-binding protein, partial [Streptomyces sp. NPDC058664]|uniref:ATP-binding protein n=1 Tax=Streptomyces sp. NPDC058664 TaxID=3346585 RepID=UPI0036670603
NPPREIHEGPLGEVPQELRRFVQRDQISYQFTTVADPDGYRGRALVIGSPSAEVTTLEIYLIFPLASEESSLSLMRGTMLIGGVVLLVLLAAITALVTRQVVLPIRSAARIAGRFADGRLKERMLVRGEDDMARLAQAFNEMAESLSNQITQLEEFGNLQRRFTSDVSHELRTPLTAMRTDLQVLAGTELPDDQRGAVLADVLAAESQIERTLTDLERLAVGELTDQDAFEPFELCETLDRAVQNARRANPGVDITLTACDPVPVHGLPGGIMLIVTNAVANAVLHGKATEVTVATRTTGNGVEITVDDNGTGIPEALSPTAFDRFAKRPGSPGSGLGLALVRQQAELHSGTAELDHSPLGGVRLRL